MSNQQKVRSMLSYGKRAREWGTDVSHNSVTIVNTKLDLEPRENRVDELESTLHLLNGAGNLCFKHIREIGPEPAFTTRSPTEIVTDYLTKIRQCACLPTNIDLDLLARTKTPVDIVITVPVNWSYAAKNATFKAFRDAGFNKSIFTTLEDTILISEPEAASYFTARDQQADLLSREECFVLVDAGGGTVDVVSYQVKQTASNFKIDKATDPESGRCGSVFIDMAFKKWLRKTIEPHNYYLLDPANAGKKRIYPYASESGPMREVINRFEAKKKVFDSSTTEIRLDLPEPLDKLTIPGKVNQGQLTITSEDMEDFFSYSINAVLGLIDRQIDKVSENENRRIRDLFLVGGFGESPYLQEVIESSLELRDEIELRKPKNFKS